MGSVENNVGKGENAANQHFLIFPQCFQKLSYTGSLKVGNVWQRVNMYKKLDTKIQILTSMTIAIVKLTEKMQYKS